MAKHEAFIDKYNPARVTATLDGRTVPGSPFISEDEARAAITRAMKDWYDMVPDPSTNAKDQ